MSFEPYRIKVVESLPLTTWEERANILSDVGYNPMKLEGQQVTIDLMTDSGFNGVSSAQMAAMFTGDESYGISTSYTKFVEKIKSLTGFKYIIPTHTGRAAEHLLIKTLLKEGDCCYGNGFFDTTRVNIQRNNCRYEPFYVEVDTICESNGFGKFQGNIDCKTLKENLERATDNVGLVIMTITNNARFGQPVSLNNIKEASEICKKHSVPFYADACRFAENAWFVKENENEFSDETIENIVLKMFSYFDGCYVSAKKDGICNNGGFLATSDDNVYNKCRLMKIPIEGGVTGRDYEAMVVGYSEVLTETYLRHRFNSIQKFATILADKRIPLRAVGGHAVYIDAEKLFPHLSREDYPAWTLCCELFLQGGVRSIESGNLVRGYSGGPETFDNEDLVRLAIPRRVYTASHFRHVANVLSKIKDNAKFIMGMKIAKTEDTMRVFTLKMEPKYQIRKFCDIPME